jgi:hypothetical protein
MVNMLCASGSIAHTPLHALFLWLNQLHKYSGRAGYPVSKIPVVFIPQLNDHILPPCTFISASFRFETLPHHFNSKTEFSSVGTFIWFKAPAFIN